MEKRNTGAGTPEATTHKGTTPLATAYERLKAHLPRHPKTWLITGVAGFIGSNLLERLLRLDQTVVGLDDFSTGRRGNLDEVRSLVTDEQWGRFRFIEGDIRGLDVCREACRSVDLVLHQAALGSVPWSVADPLRTNACNVDGFINVLVAARDASVRRVVYASSSAVYGDDPGLPKTEGMRASLLSPYAVSKYVDELYGDVFSKTYGIETIGRAPSTSSAPVRTRTAPMRR